MVVAEINDKYCGCKTKKIRATITYENSRFWKIPNKQTQEASDNRHAYINDHAIGNRIRHPAQPSEKTQMVNDTKAVQSVDQIASIDVQTQTENREYHADKLHLKHGINYPVVGGLYLKAGKC